MKHILKHIIGAYVFKGILKNGSIIDKNGTINTDDLYRFKLDFSNVTSISSTKNVLTKGYVIYHTCSNEKFYQRNTLKNIVNDTEWFVFISKARAININKIAYVSPNFSTIYMQGEKTIKLTISRRYKQEFKERLDNLYIV